MLAPAAVYPLIEAWLKVMGVASQTNARRALAQVVAAVLGCHSLNRTALMRSLPTEPQVPARQRYKRLARLWDRAWLTPAHLTPCLVQTALALIPASLTPHLAMDTLRCGAWETITIGVVWHRRVLPLAWAVLPYPMPKGVFTPTVCALIEQLAAVWPATRPPHLVADRGFPSQLLFQTLTAVGWGYTIRLRASDRVRIGDDLQRVRTVLEQVPTGSYRRYAARFSGRPQAVAATLVVGRSLPVIAAHQRDDGSARARSRAAVRRLHDLRQKHPRQRPDRSPDTDRWMVLFTTHASTLAAVRSYRLRWATESSYRDAQSGWDGQVGWGLEQRVASTTTSQEVTAVFGLWALATIFPTYLGDQLSQPDLPIGVRQVRDGWTTSGRLSVWARGRLALGDLSGHLTEWIIVTLTTGADFLARRLAPPPPIPLCVPPAVTRAAVA